MAPERSSHIPGDTYEELIEATITAEALLTYAWLAFIVTPFDDVPETVNLIGNVGFALGAVVLLAAAYATVRRTDDPLDSDSGVA